MDRTGPVPCFAVAAALSLGPLDLTPSTRSLAGGGGQAVQDLLQQLTMLAQRGPGFLTEAPQILVHKAQPVGHGVDLRRKRVPKLLLQLLDAALKLLQRGHVGRIARRALKLALPRPQAGQDLRLVLQRRAVMLCGVAS